MAFTSLLALLAALSPNVLAQSNTTYVDYNTDPEPGLYDFTQNVVDWGFPDCANGPLKDTIVCDSSARPHDRAAALVSMFTLEELVNCSGNLMPAIPRLGLPPYQVWAESLHGIDRANWTDSGDFSWTTAFPSPILTMASLNRSLIHQIGSILSTQARALNNFGRYGLNVYSPNINPFRHPVWGRGQETPGEDANVLGSAYAFEYITGVQGGLDPYPLKIIANAKHFVGYDIENWNNHSRLGNDMIISQQDLSEYYSPSFKTAIKDARVHSVMSSYNAVNGVPSSANTFLLQTLVRDTWDFVQDGFISSDCDAVYNVFNPHGYASTAELAASKSMLAGTDIDCGITYQFYMNNSFARGEISRSEIERGVVRFYSNLASAGYFDGANSKYRDLDWSDIVSTDALNVSYQSAVESIVLLKNDGILPLSNTSSVALIGPWANATTQMKGNYLPLGNAPYLTSPLAAFQNSHFDVNYAFGTNITSNSTAGFENAISAAKMSDVIIFAGGIDNTVESEAQDRQEISWPGNQLDLIKKLSQLGKPLIILQMGGGQVDSSVLKASKNVNAILWGGYPGQSGGLALFDILTGKRAPAGRLTATQYPAKYAHQFAATDMSLRPNSSNGNPGQTYMWYTGKPVFEFGHGLFYTTFDTTSKSPREETYNIHDLLTRPHVGYNTVEQRPFFNYTVNITNTGAVESDYTAMAFVNSTAGPRPHPNKWLVGFDRLGELQPQSSQLLNIPISLDAIARTDVDGNRIIYPGKYELVLNNERSAIVKFTLTGNVTTLATWPKEAQLILPS